jgi:hypothetical protein
MPFHWPAAMRPKYLGTPATWTRPFGVRAHNHSLLLKSLKSWVTRRVDSDPRHCHVSLRRCPHLERLTRRAEAVTTCCVMRTALPVAEESRSCIKQRALLFETIQAAFSASLYVLIGRSYAVTPATFAATLVATKFLMRRRVRSTNASLSARQLSSRTPTA